MPVEHETKYILGDSTADLIKALGAKYPVQHIHQVYLTKNNRFRAIVKQTKKASSVLFYHTFKKRIEGEVLELETKISSDDFDMVRKAKNLGELHKIRFTIPQAVGQWDVDFLLTAPLSQGGEIYFACAECEQPKEFEVVIPKILAKHLKWEVPFEESTLFSNFKLTDREYAAVAVERHLELLKPCQV